MAALTATHHLDLSSRSYAQDPSAPDPVRPHVGAVANGPRDELDDLFNHDHAAPDTFQDTANSNNNATDTDAALAARRRAARQADGDASDVEGRGLGIDEEVKVKKARAPIAKLDETRLLSDKGIPKLRKITKDRLKFKGKGHEYSDIARLLSTYQLWLDDLFPKARFADGLAIIEKLGHTRRLQVMRKEWIDEGKPKADEPEMSGADDDFVMRDNPEGGHEQSNEENEERTAGAEPEEHTQQPIPNLQANTHNNDDLYAPPSPQFAPVQRAAGASQEDEPKGDELDQLLAEDTPMLKTAKATEMSSTEAASANFEDEEEAMAGMDWM